MALSKAFHAFGVIDDLKRKITSRHEQWRSTRRENERLRRENEQLRQQREQLEQERERLREENDQLKRQLAEAQRASKRQAAPFSRGTRVPHPRRPGRKPGAAYGTRYRKPLPDQVDDVIAVPAPARCSCGGTLDVEKIESQYQHEIVRQTIWTRFDVTICRCTVCHQRVHGRDPRQTSNAFGAAAVQIGPDALGLAVTMNKRLGMPHADVVTVLQDGFGLDVNRSTVCRAVERVARRGEATWHALREAARRSLVNAIDETGWNVAAQLRWLWVVVSEQVTFCDILPGRGFAQAASLVGADYDGWLTHDGWAAYYKFLKAGHQSCLAHLIRRCRDVAALATPAAARFPLRVNALLEEGLALRDRYKNKEISLHGLWTATGRLEVKLDRVLARSYRDPANRRLANHLGHERPSLFTFLYCPGLDATNNAAERAIRALIGARKNWGGNRTPNGARAQAVLTSLFQTATQQGKNPFDVVVELLCSRESRKILDLVPLNRETLHNSSPTSPRPVAKADRFPSSSLSDLAIPA
jgi:transposase